MLSLLTSCGRKDLLFQTMESLKRDQQADLDIIIHEDSPIGQAYFENTILTGGLGQHGSIEKFLKEHDEKYYLHLEDDWEFTNRYDWLEYSRQIMESRPEIIKVLARDRSPHPCNHNCYVRLTLEEVFQYKYGVLEPWQNTDSLWWCGWSWNPGVTRMDLLKQFMPFPKWEQDLGLKIHDAGYKIAELAMPVYTHIGEEHSTHHPKKAN